LSRELSRIHRWVGLPVLAFALGMTGLWSWKMHLIRQLRAASADQQLERCLKLERQLQSLEWVPSPPHVNAGRCRREAAERLWGAQKLELALRLQQELVSSKSATEADMQRLRRWRGELQRSALSRFETGDLAGALAQLRLSDTTGRDPGIAAMRDQLQQIWGKNQQALERARAMAAKQNWWEALAALNHPYWRDLGLPLRKTVEAGLAKLEKKRVETHGPLPYAISRKSLDEQVKRRLEAGVPEWQAFGEACRALGGRVVDSGPEATCQQ
jgi:hypothetical protein